MSTIDHLVSKEQQLEHKDDPDFFKRYENDFKEQRDKNKDGKMDKVSRRETWKILNIEWNYL